MSLCTPVNVGDIVRMTIGKSSGETHPMHLGITTRTGVPKASTPNRPDARVVATDSPGLHATVYRVLYVA
jgi:hypothetical protein